MDVSCYTKKYSYELSVRKIKVPILQQQQQQQTKNLDVTLIACAYVGLAFFARIVLKAIAF